ncbi:hypothetical protein NBO_588g0003 [Nosema bombycis CQ1]|uniref:Uncharacterized protein n=1 Tax=Nosema bombycis (strain CQ1 / CVCC 102059) TaxID=578461 RepID=R0KPB0_NOSB1|nr:hypothetical protein NBO_588g0003 [Nosema bombycis CQ1]|eukprot:EOB12022.1 hypothetical protein NBO_588g0003 [Nosema bombycis CQ1]
MKEEGGGNCVGIREGGFDIKRLHKWTRVCYKLLNVNLKAFPIKLLEPFFYLHKFFNGFCNGF